MVVGTPELACPPDHQGAALISVIIPVRNGSRTLPACLQALQQQTRSPDEIIVVDDGSTDNTAAVAAQQQVTVISQAQAGPASARNYGAQMAQGDLLLFTDADCVPAADWVERLVGPFADPTVAGAKGEYRTRQRALVARFVQQEYQDRYDRMSTQVQIDFVDTYSAAYRRRIFLEAGGFDPTFPTASVEDQEFSFRLAARGDRLVYVPGAIVYHRHDRSLAEYATRKYWIGYWKALVTRRYPAKLARDSHTPQSLKLQLGLAMGGGLLLFGGAVSGNKRLKAGGWLMWGTLLMSAVNLYQQIWRRDAPVLTIAPLLVFLRALALGCGFLLGNLRLLFSHPYRPPNENKRI
jgi:glycosyltransferase involved in cell wall biosynthesis